MFSELSVAALIFLTVLGQWCQRAGKMFSDMASLRASPAPNRLLPALPQSAARLRRLASRRNLATNFAGVSDVDRTNFL